MERISVVYSFEELMLSEFAWTFLMILYFLESIPRSRVTSNVGA